MTTSEIEREIICAILKKNEVYYQLGIQLRDFTDPDFRAVFETMGRMLTESIDVDIVALHTFNPKLQAGKLSELEPLTAANAQYYADTLKAATKRRETAVLFREALERVKEDRHTDEIIDDVTSELLRISEHRDIRVGQIKDAVFPAMDEIKAAREAGSNYRGVASGFSDIDNVTNGFRNGDLTVLAARPSIGKTTLALNMIANMDHAGDTPGFFSAESPEIQIMHRLLACTGHVMLQSIRTGMLSPADFSRLGDACERFYKSDMYIDDTPGIKFRDLRNKARMMVARGVKVLFVDHLTLVKHGDQKRPKWERVGDLAREFKTLARELEVPLILLCQLNRDAEGSEPSMDNLRHSGEIEEVADNIIFMHRERSGEEQCDTIINLAKQRNGPTERMHLHFVQAETRFEQKVRRENE